MLRAALSKRRTAGSNQISVRSNVSGTGSSSVNNATTAAMSSNASGSTFLVGVASASGSSPTDSVTDSKGNTYTAVGPILFNAADGISIQVFMCVNGVGGASHTFTGQSFGAAYVSVIALELTGTTGVLDGSQVSASTSGTSYTSGNLTSTNARDSLFGFAMLDAATYPQSLSAVTGVFITGVSVTAAHMGIGASVITSNVVGTAASQFSGSPNGTFGGVIAFALKSI